MSHPHLTLMLPLLQSQSEEELNQLDKTTIASFGLSCGSRVTWEPMCTVFRLHKIRILISLRLSDPMMVPMCPPQAQA